MDLFTITADDLFSTAGNQQEKMETLANQALSGGIEKYISKDYEGAAKSFQRAYGLAPYSVYAYEATKYLAMSYTKLNQPDKAVKAYEQALKVSPGDDRLHTELANLHFSAEQYGNAIKHYEQAVRLYDDANNRFSLGQGYLKAGRYQDAENQFEKVVRLAPQGAIGYFGLGQAYAQQKKYKEAVNQFERAVSKNRNLYSAYAEMGYAYVDMRDFKKAEEVRSYLESKDPAYADTLKKYISKKTTPKIEFAFANSTFKYYMQPKTPLAAMDAYFANANASRTLTMKFQFNKEMDRASVENILNWQIKRASGYGPGQNYNFGQGIPETEVALPQFPINVYYDADKLTATIFFSLTQNETANGTIDPKHIEFKFKGKDADGNDMDAGYDQFTGFSGSF